MQTLINNILSYLILVRRLFIFNEFFISSGKVTPRFTVKNPNMILNFFIIQYISEFTYLVKMCEEMGDLLPDIGQVQQEKLNCKVD